MVLPVVLFAVIANIHRFFMLSTTCHDVFDEGSGEYEYEDTYSANIQDLIPRKESLFCEDGQELLLMPTQFRMNRYVTMAQLLVTFLNTIVPVIIMMVLIFLSYRDIKKGLISLGSTPNEYEDLQKKHDLDLCLRTVYAVFIFGICHGLELIPLGFEILMDSNMWIYHFYIFTNMLVAVACSINCFAYYGVYGKVLQSNTAENGDTERRSQMETNL
eukprot:GFUD01079114.1.p1 GENE.GFUD01079114.1~~GFUD01079114.1.p1  ORF type:complete len:249 (+),score=24.56 GFUD01079114.1:100-747(+)